MDYTIREASVSDVDQIATVARDTWNVTYGGSIAHYNRQEFLTRAYAPQALGTVIARDAGNFYVATYQNTVVGYSQYVSRFDGQGELVRLYVHPQHQGRGVGQGFLLAGALALRAEQVRLCYVSAHAENNPALGFYERCGFQTHREFARFLGDQLIQLVELRIAVADLLKALLERRQGPHSHSPD